MREHELKKPLFSIITSKENNQSFKYLEKYMKGNYQNSMS